MRLTQIVGAVSLLFLMVTWILLRSFNQADAKFGDVLVSLDRFAMLEAALERDALAARAGVLRNYDSLAQGSAALTDFTNKLAPKAADYPGLRTSRDRLAGLVDQQLKLIEQFKSDNALLQNSLAYFQLFGAVLGGATDRPTVSAATALDSAMLRLTLDTSPEAVEAVANRLKQLAAMPSDDLGHLRSALIAHASLLERLLPRIDGLLKAMRALPIPNECDNLRDLVLAQQNIVKLWARRLDLLLYAFSIALLVSLGFMARALRVRARILKERATFDHLVAGTSMRFLNAPSDAIEVEIEHSLPEFAACFGADRAYFLQFGKTSRRHVWQRETAPALGGWFEALPNVAAALDVESRGIAHVTHPSRLKSGMVRSALAEAGIVGWLGLGVNDSDGEWCFLGFDAFAPGRLTDKADLGFARLALDVLMNAATRSALTQEHARLTARLQQTQRMETLGAFASGIAHNFNNLIGAILGYAEIAVGQVTTGGRLARNLEEIRNAGDRARELVNAILAFGRPRVAAWAAVRVDTLIAEAASLLRASLPPAVELVFLPIPEVLIVPGEAIQLQQVLLNLCANAAKAMADQGRLEIAADGQDVGAPRTLNHGALKPGRYVRITVSDNGCGMSAEIIARIFEPFFTTRHAGNGLGLATVKEIVREHDGALAVRSRPGHGSRFEVWLPRAVSSLTRKGAAPSGLPDRLRTILLIDKNQDRLERDEEILAAIGYEPVGFDQPEDAFAAWHNAPHRFDALIVGHVETSADLLALSATLRAIARTAPVLLATSNAEQFAASALASAGVREVISQPFDPAGLGSALHRSLGLIVQR